MAALVPNLPAALRSPDALVALLGRTRRVLTPSTIHNALLIAFTVALVQRYLRARRALRATGWIPGLRLAIDPIFPYPLPAIPWVSMEPDWWVRLGYGGTFQAYASTASSRVLGYSFRARRHRRLVCCESATYA